MFLPPRNVIRQEHSSALSSVPRAQHHLVARTQRPHCLAGPLPAPAAPTQATLPHYGVSTTWLTVARHRLPAGGHSGSQVRNSLRHTVHVTSGCYPAGRLSYVPGFPPGIVSAGLMDQRFRGTEDGSIPLPVALARQTVFAIRHRLRCDSLASPLQAFRGYATRRRFFRPNAGPGQRSGSAFCKVGNSPRQQTLCEPLPGHEPA